MNLKRIVTAGALLLAVAASAFATVYVNAHAPKQPEVVVIESSQAAIVLKAPDKAKIGQLVVLDVSESEANSYRWEHNANPNNFLVIDEGRRAVFSAEIGGEYTFVVAAAKGDSVDVRIHTIKVTGAPSTPTDEFTAKLTRWCEPVNSPTKRDDVIKLAQSFSSVAAIITDQMTPTDIVEATKKSNRDALGDNIQNWVPFLEGLQGELKAQAQAGKLPDTESHRRMWQSIAESLKEYAATL